MKFSVGIPAYKSIFLKECLDSIMAQTYTDFEVIIVNDASPEDIDSIVTGYDSSKIKYFKNSKNFGAVNVVDNWNKCLSYAVGDYFILMGDDDKMCPNYLEEFNRLITQYPLCGVYHCRTIVIDEKSNAIAVSESRPEFETVFDSILQRMIGNRLFFISDHVFRVSLLRSNRGFYKLPLAWASDDISAFTAAKENGIAHTNNAVFMYRRNAQTISSTGNVYIKMDAALVEEQWLKSFTDYPSAIINDTDILVLQRIKFELKKFIKKKKLRTIATSLQSNPLKIFNWVWVKRKYEVTNLELLYALMLSLKEKRKSKYA